MIDSFDNENSDMRIFKLEYMNGRNGQSIVGLSKKIQASFLKPIVTSRYKVSRGQLIAISATNNTGIESYALEILCKPEMKNVFLRSFLRKWNRVLFRDIIKKSVPYQGRLFWRWEFSPKRADYFYPPDWDDTFKAIDAISSYREFLKKEISLKLPPCGLLYNLIKSTVYYDRTAGQDIKVRCKNGTSLYMFISDIKNKQNNTEDIMVTAVAIRSILNNYRQISADFLSLLISLYEKIVEVAEIGINDSIPFEKLSRCYFSWGLFLMTLLDIEKYIKSKSHRIKSIALRYLRDMRINSLPISRLYKNLIVDEINYAKLIALTISQDPNEHILCWIHKNPILEQSVFPPVLYQHRRLEHYYGNPLWSFLLSIYAMEKESAWSKK